ncbi:MAG: ABC transporter ATP-binding protein [Anaerolineae bacterium]|nr:ABC transporter ATP-binding protein [Anaerolineae bacterium]
MRMHGMGWFSYIHFDDAQDKPQVSWALIRRVLGYAKPYRWKIAGVLALILVSQGLSLLSPLLFGQIIDKALYKGDGGLLDRLALVIVIIPILNGVIGVVQRYFNSSIGEGVIYQLRTALYSHLQNMSLHFFTNTKTGELMSRLNNDVVGAQSAINSTLIGIFTNIISVVSTLVVMLLLEWRLTLLGLIVVPLFVLPARRIGRALRNIVREQMDLNASMNAMMNETLNVSGALLVKLFGRTQTESVRFEDRARKVADSGVRRSVIGSGLFAALGLISAVGMALTYWVGGHFAIDGVFSAGLIVTFAMYLGQIYGPLQSLANSPVDFATSMVSFERVFELLDMPLEIAEKPDAVKLEHVRGEVVFDNVSFSYSEHEHNKLKEVDRGGMSSVRAVFSEGRPVRPNGKPSKEADAPLAESQARTITLHNISFMIKPGQLAALVGPSGAGKTTITYLMPRLYDPYEGHIKIDGHDLRDLTLASLAENIGMVTQETYLFHDTIRTNLLYAKSDATQAEIEAAARAANIHDFIMGLPDNYDTIVGERGYRLSGGEKQRIAIARVILKDPRILVLDEATSHLDSQSEALIQTALETVMKDRTSLVIAHRLSTILAADLILVLDRGQIVEQGTHAELLAKNGLYATLYETQFKRDRFNAGVGMVAEMEDEARR